MAWYLYIVGIVVTFYLCVSMNLISPAGRKTHPITCVLVSATWPVSFPALLVGGLLSSALGGADGKK